MPLNVQVAGLATIKIGQADCANGQLLTLGYTVNGARIRDESFWDDVHGDQHGGDAGPPIEVLYLGKKASVTLELSKWDAAVADKIAARLWSSSPGVIGPIGTPVLAAGEAFRLVIHCAAAAGFDFRRAVPREPIEVNKGTRHSLLLCVFDCYADPNGVLYQPFAS